MKNTFLFDLDGTLLPMDFHQFMNYYFHSISDYFKDKVAPQELIRLINETTKYTVMTNDGRTNEVMFMDHFNKISNIGEDLDIVRFYKYYETAFDLCKKATWQDENIIEAVRIIKEKGYQVVIATNPLLPLRSNHSRIRWAGFEPSDFSYISSFEGNKYCKPHLEFYNEVLEHIGKTPEECYMIGNDTQEDLVAGKLGLETYLITDCMLDEKEMKFEPNHQGLYVDFLEFVKKLKTI